VPNKTPFVIRPFRFSKLTVHNGLTVFLNTQDQTILSRAGNHPLVVATAQMAGI
jgi:hypothetical protein